jgi:predicted nucleotidyltransferase
MNTALETHSSAIADLCIRFHVQKLEVFGSATRGRDFDPKTSDFDFAVKFQSMTPGEHFDAFFGLSEALEQLLGRKVDLVELHVAKNQIFLKSVLKEKQVIYIAE